MLVKQCLSFYPVRKLVFWLSSLFLMVLGTANAQELVVGIDHYPPWMVTNEQPYAGIDVEIVNKIAADLSLTVKFVVCPFKRCLKMAKDGQVDLVPGLFKTAEREKYLAFIEPSYTQDPPKVFYVNKKKPVKIVQYDDLNHLTIGVKRGANYFEQFDQDDSLKKFVINHESQLFELLKIGRIDTFIGAPLLVDYFIVKEGYQGLFIKVPYSYGNGRPSYMALSKKSHFVKDIEMFQHSIQKLLDNGLFAEIIQTYVNEHPN